VGEGDEDEGDDGDDGDDGEGDDEDEGDDGEDDGRTESQVVDANATGIPCRFAPPSVYPSHHPQSRLTESACVEEAPEKHLSMYAMDDSTSASGSVECRVDVLWTVCWIPCSD